MQPKIRNHKLLEIYETRSYPKSTFLDGRVRLTWVLTGTVGMRCWSLQNAIPASTKQNSCFCSLSSAEDLLQRQFIATWHMTARSKVWISVMMPIGVTTQFCKHKIFTSFIANMVFKSMLKKKDWKEVILHAVNLSITSFINIWRVSKWVKLLLGCMSLTCKLLGFDSN